ncbi:unnamed protein product [Spirodela intermedia]|uniref:Phytocyanin domain-containing protein n=1 Tax=Spirodela intermedia TaxID=51605 RepID=A0A7I8IPR4_SPIIN|nr:unnamed protein product [Spirodela intermedia]CAA6659132.1 unnamed protein product [Spirodela intermedia]
MAASSFWSGKALIVILVLLSSVGSLSVAGVDYEVGDDEGWKVPSSGDPQFYNQWASKNRFRVGDAVVFKYRKDSVMVVTEEDYGNCNSSHPILFDNGGEQKWSWIAQGPSSSSAHRGSLPDGPEDDRQGAEQLGGAGGSPAPANQTGPAAAPTAPDGSAAAPATVVSSLLWVLLLSVPLFSSV